MFRNYLKIAWRNLLKNKVYSAINVFGLAAGMAATLLIGLWVYYQYSWDKFLPGYEQLYRVQRNFNSNGDTLTFRTSSLRLADELRANYPEIEAVAESDWMGFHGLMVGEKKIYLQGAQIGKDFLTMFRYPLLKGNAAVALQDPYSIVLTEQTAHSLFGPEDPIGKMVRINNRDDLKVTAVLKDLPANSSIKFNFLIPFAYRELTATNGRLNHESFDGNSYQVFVKLREGSSLEQLAPRIRNMEHVEKSPNALNSYITLQPLKRWHLYSNYVNGKDKAGFLEYVQIFTIIGVLILLIACINFVNLTTARSEKRAREVGVRKAIGSEKRQLVLQFLSESFLLILIAFLFAMIILQICLPAFNALVVSEVSIPYANPGFWALMIGFILLTTLIAGSRPAFYLSSFLPVKVLKGTLRAGKGQSTFRRVLVVAQFACSIALIVSTIVIYRQVQHAKNRPSGYDLSRLVQSDVNRDLRKNFTALKNEMIEKGIVSSVTTASSPATDIYWHSDLDHWPGKRADQTIEMGVVLVTADYFKTLGMDFARGRDFSGDHDSLSVVFNEAAIASMGLKDPLAAEIEFQGERRRIVGVVKDALMISPFAGADPTMFIRVPEMLFTTYEMMYRLSPGIKTSDALAQLNTLFNKYSPAFPYKYWFADEQYAEKYNLEVLIGKLSAIFAILAIFISCLGLFGLAAYVAERRTKEIGIRKVLGASVSQLWLMLSKDFIALVLISSVIAIPISLYFLQGWLSKYAYRIDIGVMVFVWSSLIALAIALIVISFQAVKAALMSPVKSLKSE